MTRRRRVAATVTLLGLAVLLTAPAPAAPAATPAPAASTAGADADCPRGNLLATARLVDSLDCAGYAARVVNDTVAVEGAKWWEGDGVVFRSRAGALTYDLGAERPIRAALVQGDAKDRFSLQISDDGTTFREIWAVPAVTNYGLGMRTRSKLFWDLSARYVRFGEASGFGPHGVSEVQVFCRLPDVWPARPAVAAAAPTPTPPSPSNPPRRFTRKDADAVKLGLALLGATLLLWGAALRRRGVPDHAKRLRDVLLLVLGLIGYLGYYNWGQYHFSARVHTYEFFHYYIGSKYFPELGYTDIYDCACLAEAEQGYRRRIELRTIRDLHRNELVPAAPVLTQAAELKRGFARPFTPERWEAFKHDIAYFRDRMGIEQWEKALQDHGYNPSPMWTLAGTLLANLGPASDRQIDGFLSWIDPVLLLIAFAFITWAFGWRVACVAALFFGTNEPALYFWTGGAFLRQAWFVCAVAGVCLIKRGRSALGGASLAVSTLFRLFPLGFFVAVGMRFVWILAKERRLDRTGLRIIAGAAIAVALFVPLSSVVSGGFASWPAFFQNIEKHESTPLTNDMGLRTIVAFRWNTRQKVTYEPTQVDPFHAFKEARRNTLNGLFGRPLFYALVLGYAALLFFRVVRREMEWWVMAAFGFGVIPIFLEMTCYYFSFLVAAAFFYGRRDAIPIGLLYLAAVTQFIEFQTYYYDIRYTSESVAVIAFVVWATWVYGRGKPLAERASAGPGEA
ncbi:MAG: discoidin domain-containing protein [Hyphomicrobiales bacterium]